LKFSHLYFTEYRLSAVEAKIIFIGPPPLYLPVPRWSQKWGTLSPTPLSCAALVPHFSGRKCEEFAVTCCEQRRSAEIKPFSAWAPPRTQLGELTTLSQAPESNEEGTLALHSLPLSPQDPKAPRAELVPPLFTPKLRPWKFTTK